MHIDYSYTRPFKADDMKKKYAASFENNNKLEVQAYKNATILPTKKFQSDSLLFGRGGVVDESGEYVELSSIPNRLDKAYECSSAEFCDQKVVYAGYLVYHWGHFLVEGSTRLWYFLKNDPSIDKYVFMVEEGRDCTISANYKEFLELLGIWDKLEIINKPTKYREVIVPQRAYHRSKYYSNEYKAVFNAVAENAMLHAKEYSICDKIFFSRGLFKKAKYYEIGTDMLDAYFEANNYELVHPETISLTELIVKIRSAKHCACASGSIAHNMLFAKDGQELTIVERLSVLNQEQVDVDRVKELKVTYVDGHYTIYPVSMGGGPCYFAFTKQFKAYCKDRNELPPPQKFLADSYTRSCLRRYMNTYKKENYYQWGLEGSWQLNHCQAIYEAYQDTLQDLGKYLNGSVPFRLKQFTEIRILKRTISRILHR